MNGRLSTFIIPDYPPPTEIRHTDYERKINWNSFITEMCNLRAAMSWAALFFVFGNQVKGVKTTGIPVVFTPFSNFNAESCETFGAMKDSITCAF